MDLTLCLEAKMRPMPAADVGQKKKRRRDKGLLPSLIRKQFDFAKQVFSNYVNRL